MADRPETPFWRFSIAFYGQPGVAAACLRLQDERGADVNLLLLALWLGTLGHRLDRRTGQALQRAARHWQRPLVAPLRLVRRRLKRRLGSLEGEAAAHLAALRGELARLELELERVEQEALEALVGEPAQGCPDREVAAHNLDRLGLERVTRTPGWRLLLDTAFPVLREFGSEISGAAG